MEVAKPTKMLDKANYFTGLSRFTKLLNGDAKQLNFQFFDLSLQDSDSRGRTNN